MRFKAEILGLMAESKFQDVGMVEPGHNKSFTFTRSKIFFTPNQNSESYYLHLNKTSGNLEGKIVNGNSYTFQVVYDREDKKRFAISLNPQFPASSYLKMNLINRIKCNLVHKRYIFQRDADWFWKTLIAGGLGAIFGLIGANVGYKQGFRDGLKEEKSRTQDTARKEPSKIPLTGSAK